MIWTMRARPPLAAGCPRGGIHSAFAAATIRPHIFAYADPVALPRPAHHGDDHDQVHAIIVHFIPARARIPYRTGAGAVSRLQIRCRFVFDVHLPSRLVEGPKRIRHRPVHRPVGPVCTARRLGSAVHGGMDGGSRSTKRSADVKWSPDRVFFALCYTISTVAVKT